MGTGSWAYDGRKAYDGCATRRRSTTRAGPRSTNTNPRTREPPNPRTNELTPNPRHPQPDPRDDLPLDLVVAAAEGEDHGGAVAAFQFAVQDGARGALLQGAGRGDDLHEPGVGVTAGLGAVDLDGGGVLRGEGAFLDGVHHLPVEEFHRVEPRVGAGEEAAHPGEVDDAAAVGEFGL